MRRDAPAPPPGDPSMRSEVTVVFDARRTVDLSVDVEPSVQAAAAPAPST
ncbi:hypothetical protein L560_4025 [Bordetella pertussis STO1-CHOC-0018]|nr:hypothetical protein L560_4025 [Bordetella pertussis STO1-CHOC-0018]